MPGLRALHKNTMQTLGEPHTLPTLTASFLLCLLVGMASYLFCRFLSLLAVLYLPHATAELLQITAIPIFEVVLAVLLLLPLWLGRMRMAGLLLLAERPVYGACFYYFGTAARYFRAVGASAILALAYGLAGLAVYGSFAGAVSLYRAVLLIYLPRIAPLLLVLLLHVALAATAGIIYLSGVFLPFAAIVVGNEELSTLAALARAVRVGRKHLGKSFLFSVRQLLWLALCLASVMVLYVLWYSHYFNLFYLRYSKALTEDAQ